jgi:anti-anti-sigma factor
MHPKEFIKVLEQDIKAFTGGHPQNDDITVVAVKEKLTADDVLYGIRKKLIDLVDIQGLSVKEACSKMKVSPATYYRYKKRMAVMGERGLRNKVLRQDLDLKRVSIEERKTVIAIVQKHPEYGAKRIAEVYNVNKRSGSRDMTEKMIYDELKRLNLNTKEMRIDYLKRNRLIDGDEPRPTSKDMVEDLLSEVAATTGDLESGDVGEPDLPAGADLDAVGSILGDSDALSDVSITTAETDEGVVVLKVDGHLDSVSSASLEKRLKEIIAGSATRIVVDLADVSYISSGGWGIFVGEVRRLREQSGDVVLVGMSAEVYDVYELLGFNDILRAFNTAPEAIAYLGRPAEERFSAPAGANIGEPLYDHASSLVDEIQQDTYSGEWESLTIEATTVGETSDMAVISLRGIIDTISAEHLRAAIDKVITSGIFKLVIDMSLVEYVSSGGWGTFTERLRELRRNDGDVKLFGMDPDVYYVFTMLGFNIVLSSFDIMSDAIEDFNRGADGRPSVHPGQGTAKQEVNAPVIDITDVDDDDDDLSPEVFDEAPIHSSAQGRRVHWSELNHGVSVANIRGMIEAASVDQIDREVQSRLDLRPEYVIFDLSNVDYVSSTGWGLFAKYHQCVEEWGGSMALCGMSPELNEIFSCLEFYSFIRSFNTAEEALAARPSGSAKPPTAEAPPQVPEMRADAPGTPIQLDDDELAAADEILDLGDVAEPERPDAPQGRWPESDQNARPKFKPGSVDDPVEANRDESEQPAGEPDDWHGSERRDLPDAQRRPDYGQGFVDVDDESQNVDVDGSTTGERVDDDKRIRDLGWGEYGDRLKSKMDKKEKKKKKKKNDDQ